MFKTSQDVIDYHIKNDELKSLIIRYNKISRDDVYILFSKYSYGGEPHYNFLEGVFCIQKTEEGPTFWESIDFSFYKLRKERGCIYEWERVEYFFENEDEKDFAIRSNQLEGNKLKAFDFRSAVNMLRRHGYKYPYNNDELLFINRYNRPPNAFDELDTYDDGD